MPCQTIRSKYSGETLVYYADMTNTLGYGATVSAVVSVLSGDTLLTITSAAVLTVDTTVLDEDGDSYVIAADKGVKFTVAGGTPESTATIVVTVTSSNGETIEEPFKLNVLKASGTSSTLSLKQGQTGDLVLTAPSANIVPDMTSAKVYLSVRAVSGRRLMQLEGVVTTPTGTQKVTFDITPDYANLLEPGKHLYDVMVIYGYSAGPPVTYTDARLFVGGKCEVTRLELLPDTI